MRSLKRTVIRTGLGLSVAMILMGFACGGDISITGPPQVRRCEIITRTANWPSNGDIFVDKPTECPFKTTSFVFVDYGAQGVFNVGETARIYRLTVTDRLGRTVSSFAESMWTFDVDGRDYLQVTGEYTAASGGFASGGQFPQLNDPGFDDAHNQITLPFNATAEAVGRINYVYGFPSLDIEGPTLVDQSSSFELSGHIHDVTYTPPVRWSWYVDGVLAPSTTGEMQGWAGEGGSMTRVEAISVDGNGTELRSEHYVRAIQRCEDPTQPYC